MTMETIPHLRPLGVGQLLDQAIRLYRRHFWKFIGIIAIVEIPATLLSLAFSLLSTSDVLSQVQNPQRWRTTDNPFSFLGLGYFVGITGSCFLGIATLILLNGVAMAAMARSVAGAYFGQPVGLLDSYRKIAKYLPRLIGAMAFSLLLNLGLLIWWFVPCIGWITGLGIWLFFMMAIMYLIAPVIVFERRPAVQAIRRAWDLVRRRFWWVAGFLSILYLFNMLITAGPVLLLTVASEALTMDALRSGNLALITTLRAVAQSLVSLAGSLIYTPLHMICMTLVYLDLRVRTEGFDLVMQAEGASANVEDLLAQVPPPEGQGLITWAELGRFALLSLGFMAVLAALYAIVMALILAIMGLGSFGES